MPVKLKGKSLKQLQEERANIYTEAQKYLEDNEDNWSDEHQASYDERIGDVSTLKQAIENRLAAQNVAQVDSKPLPSEHPLEAPTGVSREQLRQIVIRNYGYDTGGRGTFSKVDIGNRGQDEYVEAWGSYLKSGASGLSPDQMAALQSDNAEQAGYLVASEQFASGLLKEVDDLLFIRRYARVHTVREAASLGIRKRTSRANTFGWSSELEVSTEDTSLKFGKKVLSPHYLTGMIKVSRDLLRRGVMSVDQIVREELSRDAAEKQEDGFMTGTGDRQPLGVYTASNDGISTSRDVVTGSATSITADALRDAKYALKSKYRSMMPRWLFHRDAIKIVSKLKDGENQYLWQPGLTLGDPDRLLNFPVDESERNPNTFTNGNYVGLLAVWRFYEIADALDMEIQVLIEKYAETNQVGYIGRLKTDGMPTIDEAFVRLKCGT